MDGDTFINCLEQIVGKDSANRYAQQFGNLDEPFTDTLLNYEGLAFYAYSTELNWHERINRELWSDSPGADVVTFAKVLDTALGKLPPYALNDRIVYRGYNCDDLDRFLASYPLASRVHFRGFTSATFRQELAFGGNVLFIIKTSTGRAIWHLAANYDEFEILIPSRRHFMVLQVERRSASAVIFLEEQP